MLKLLGWLNLRIFKPLRCELVEVSFTRLSKFELVLELGLLSQMVGLQVTLTLLFSLNLALLWCQVTLRRIKECSIVNGVWVNKNVLGLHLK